MLGVAVVKATGDKELIGLPQQVDDTYYTGMLGLDNVFPLPKIEYAPVCFDSKMFGILQVHVHESGPFLPTNYERDSTRAASRGGRHHCC